MVTKSELVPGNQDIPKTAEEVAALVKKGDKRALAALELARKEVLGQSDVGRSKLDSSEPANIIKGPLGTKSPEFTAQINSDSAGQKYYLILDQALKIMQGDIPLTAHDAAEFVDLLNEATAPGRQEV